MSLRSETVAEFKDESHFGEGVVADMVMEKYAVKVRRWLDAHANDKVMNLFIVTIRVKHIRGFIEQILLA